MSEFIASPTDFTVTEAAEILGVCDRTIRRRIRSGELPAHRLRGGGRIRIRREDLAAVIVSAADPA